MKKLPYLFFTISICLFIGISCENSYPISCDDGLMNQNEDGVDCGGSCPPCNDGYSCNDNILNGTEVSVDCGGECPPCFLNFCEDGIQNNGEQGIDCGGECEVPCDLCEIEQANIIEGFNSVPFNMGSNYDEEDGEIRCFGSPSSSITFEVLIGTPSEIPPLGEYRTDSWFDVGNKSLAVRLAGFNNTNAIAGQKVYMISNDPITIIMCDLEMSGPFSSTRDIKVVCN
jgi:hypothetical protein